MIREQMKALFLSAPLFQQNKDRSSSLWRNVPVLGGGEFGVFIILSRLVGISQDRWGAEASLKRMLALFVSLPLCGEHRLHP